MVANKILYLVYELAVHIQGDCVGSLSCRHVVR